MPLAIPRVGAVDLDLEAPPSKSFTHRALIAAALADGRSTILRPLDAGDTRLTRMALEELGASIGDAAGAVVVDGRAGRLPCRAGTRLDLGNSGTSLRLLAATALLCGHPVKLTGSPRMLERPVGSLVDALNALGGRIIYEGREGFPPIRVAGRLRGGCAEMDGRISSQFASSVLMAAPYAEEPVELRILGSPVSRSYLDITLDVMSAFGIPVERDGYSRFRVPTGRYRGREYSIEGDYSSASYFFAVPAVCGGRATVRHLGPHSVQGDRQFVDILASMGCSVEYQENAVSVSRDGPLEGIEVDMAASPDTVQTLCAVAATATSPTRISGIGHLRWKESDRLAVTASLLERMGAGVGTGDDWIEVRPGPLRGIAVDPRGDHRTAMAFAVLGMAVGGTIIEDPACVEKSFPGFWTALRQAGVG